MIFLKRIEAFGFKSFADPISLNFEYGMTGIVGPNGSGKSNINDAIRWTLGEQSLKSLRGDSMEDVVFSGSEIKKGYNIAEVTLVFDNSNQVFGSLDFAEVSIKRKYDKINNESEYFINGTKVRQKDVQEIALETGLTKSSLAIISQGSVNNFVEAKPEERRQLFDEAAGVAKYKKRKDESIRKLMRSRENLDRINDIINELERRLPSLKKQAEKARTFQEKEQKLREHEVSFLVSDIKIFNSRIEELGEQRSLLKHQIESIEQDLKKDNVANHSFSTDSYSYEKKIASLNARYTTVVEKISKLEVKKVSMELSQNDTSMNESEHRVEQIKQLSKEIEIKIKSEETRLDKLLADEIELGDELSNQSSLRARSNSRLDVIRKELNKIELRIEQISDKKNVADTLFEGVKNILENRNVLPGIIGTVRDLVFADNKYLNAIGALLQQGALQNVVIETSQGAKNAIDFLKSNKAGHATFLPLDILKPSTIDNEKRFIIQNGPGFINFANELVKIDKKYQIVADYLLGGVIVVDTYNNALEMAKLIRYRFNVVTLEGERILPHGAIVGGSRKRRIQISNDADQIEKLNSEKNHYDNELDSEHKIVADLNIAIDLLREKKSVNVSAISGSKTTIKTLNSSLEKHNDEYRLLTGKDIKNNFEIFSIDSEIEKIINDISKLNTEKDEIQNELEVSTNMKNKISEQQLLSNNKTVEKNSKLLALKDEMSKISNDYSLIREKRIYAAERLAQTYNLTIDSALELELEPIENVDEISNIIKSLRQELNSLGNVNVDSILEYDEEQGRYENLMTQANDVNESITNLKDAIANMDEQMIKQFKNVITDVNKALPQTFQTLFGGGEAKIIYSNPDDILNSGIEIKVQPPGKKIANLNLLSGGEKSLVALSVLFSILTARPLPLVILDEVEAPLDIANVERFAKYIKSFTNKTQFIIVTHRIGTMENCEILYGATMEQKGITKIVNVNLIEAKKITTAS